MRAEYVQRRAWLSDDAYTGIVALCQFLPGPASSQVNMSIGIMRAGALGALVAWAGFTLPSAAALTAFALLVRSVDVSAAGWLHGIMLAAVAVVAQAVWAMAPRLAPDPGRASIAIASAVIVLLLPSALVQVAVIAVAGLVGAFWLPPAQTKAAGAELEARLPRWLSVISLALFAAILFGLPLLRAAVRLDRLALFDSFYRAGALVFGGGHVVLPLLHQAVTHLRGISDSQFLSGYGAAQAVPGPLFTFAAYLGALSAGGGVAGAVIALVAIFLPSFLLLFGVLPLWTSIRARPRFSSAISGINAGVLGLLAAALYQPVWTGAVHSAPDFCIALCGFGLLALRKVPPLAVVALCAGAGAIVSVVS
jgi:chromate transporter